MRYKLEITKKLEDLGDKLNSDNFVAILNLPDVNLCEKRSEFVEVDGEMEQACKGCVTQGILDRSKLSIGDIREVINYFGGNYGTMFITINGRGDPLHPRIKERTLEKIRYSQDRWGMQSYVFTAGNNLDDDTCRFLADHGTNVMMSLFGNRFIDAGFFGNRQYPTASGKMQNQVMIAENLRRLIGVYKTHPNQPDGSTRLGMNYVVSEADLVDNGKKAKDLRSVVHDNGICFIVSTNFEPHSDADTQRRLAAFARENTDTVYSTGVDGQCQMGAGSSVTVDFNGAMYRCPYMNGNNNGNFLRLPEDKRSEVVGGYLKSRGYACVVRKTLM